MVLCGQRLVEVRTMIQMFWCYWQKSTNSFSIESFLLASYDGWNLFSKVHPSWYRPLHSDHVRAEMTEIQDRSKSDGGSLENASCCICYPNFGHKSVAMRSSVLNDIILNWEKVQCPLNDASAGLTFKRCASAIHDALSPKQQALCALRFLGLPRTIQIALHCPCI